MKSFLHALDQLGRRCGASQSNIAHARNVVASKVRRIEQGIRHRRNQGHVRGPMLLNELENTSGLEAPHHDLLDPQHGRRLGFAPAVGVEQRDGVQIHHALHVLRQSRHGHGMQIKRTVAEHHTLGRAGAAAGVEQFGNSVLIDAENVRAFRMALVQQLFVRHIRDGHFVVKCDEALNLAASRTQHLNQRRKIVFKQQHPSAGVIQDISELQRGQSDIQRHHDSARLHHAVIAFQQLMIVETQICDTIAVLDAFFRQRSGQSFASSAEFGISELPVA